MKFFLDTNTLVYSMYQNSPKHKEVCDFLLCCLSKGAICYFLSSSLKDIYYILRRHYLTEPDARQSIKLLRETLDMVELNSTIVDIAFDSNEPDYEDALIRAAAELLQVDVIISYDEDAFKNSFIKKLTAVEVF